MALISAHRAGAGDRFDLENTLDAIEDAIALGVEYVELDVRLGVHGTFVVSHDETDEPDVLAYDDALAALAGRAKLHLDIKVVSNDDDDDDFDQPEHTIEVAMVKRAIEVLGADNVVVTTMEDRSVRAVRAWAADRHPDLFVGLSLGRLPEAIGWQLIRTVHQEVFAGRRVDRAAANLVVVHRRLARLNVAAMARKRGLPLLIWTCDDEATLRYWLSPGRAWLVTTNYPERALRIRAELESVSP